MAYSMSLSRTFAVGFVVGALAFAGATIAVGDEIKVERGEIKHSFLGVGKANRVVIVGEDGEVEWKYDKPASDGFVLKNGNVLLALYPCQGYPNGGVVEGRPENERRRF